MLRLQIVNGLHVSFPRLFILRFVLLLTNAEPADFFPLSVHYQERFSAAGRTRYGLLFITFIVWYTRL